jgi:hypothetical protein
MIDKFGAKLSLRCMASWVSLDAVYQVWVVLHKDCTPSSVAGFCAVASKSSVTGEVDFHWCFQFKKANNIVGA